MGVLVIALIIDIMKPASLGFTIPGMVSEYGVPKATASLVPFFALTGTVVGSIVWGVIADIYGRKASILLSAVMFVGTSICGAMPSLYWNIGMCFMMGAAAGGMLPVTYALLAEMMPSKHRGWALVLVGGLGAVGGYFAASGLSALLQPTFGWRIMWLLNLPTGLSLVLLGALIPEIGQVPARARTPGGGEASDGALRLQGADHHACRRGRARQGTVGGPHRPRLLRQAGRAEPRGDLLRPDQLRPAAVAACRPGREGLQHGAVEQAARRIRADRLPDRVHRRLSLQPLEHQMVGRRIGRGFARRARPGCCGSSSPGRAARSFRSRC